MGKHHVFLHIGPDDLAVDDSLLERLGEVGVSTPDVGPELLDGAALEIRRTHSSAGLRRKDVEGAWARVCRKTFGLRGDAFLSVPGFAAASTEQAQLAIDVLHGLKVHLVVSADAPPPAWAGSVRTARIHCVPAGLSTAAFADALVEVVLADRAARLERKSMKQALRRKERTDQLVA
ncbi:hypothetical protein [Nocardioides piscis]|uniref:Uncharacterized protein n=1 Tax=Nocardioides piscis TaxID=2714938 RepID=A0A6G7YEM0_9ACTN|nr:hypothetical protein [Nocardioides piscis]QIK75088.1 hypothetical protein G7071_06245 [Nocardioides piscis]